MSKPAPLQTIESRHSLLERDKGMPVQMRTLEREPLAFHVQYLLPELEGLRGRKVLEIGCAHGMLIDRLRLDGVDAYGLEKNIAFFWNYIKNKFNERIIRGGDARSTKAAYPEMLFDFVISNAVMCHPGLRMSLEPDLDALALGIHQSVFGALRPGGLAVHATIEPIIGDEHALERIGYVVLEKSQYRLEMASLTGDGPISHMFHSLVLLKP